ncbi:hypothetical protein AB1K84_17190 [Mesobacillus foraminis]|uniref:hypothetical protein n=1 Tax=Mesobacillus foraminis TaxID=279826 RepID=UPI00399FEAFF
MNRMANINSKIAGMMDIAFSMAKTSLFFWLSLIKRVFILGLVASFCTLIETIDEVWKGSGRPVRQLFKENSQKYKSTKKVSLMWFVFLIYASSFIVLPFPESLPSNIGQVIKYAFVYMVLLAGILFTFVSFNMVKLQLTVKKAILYGFYLLVKKFTSSIFLLAAFLVIAYLSQQNLIFFIFFAPAMYALSAVLILGKVYAGIDSSG